MEHLAVVDLTGAIVPESLLRDHFGSLDPESLAMRFMTMVRPEVAAAELAKRNSVVRLAVVRNEQILGLLDAYDSRDGNIEIGISVSSNMQGRGIGRALLGQAIGDRRLSGYRQVVLLMSHRNTKMRSLAQTLGAAFRRIDGMIAALFSPDAGSASAA